MLLHMLLLAGTAGGIMDAGRCQAVMDLWCGTLTQCVSEITEAGASLPLVARLGLQAEGEWRCYSPSALSENGTKYIGGPQFCSEGNLLLEVLGICSGHVCEYLRNVLGKALRGLGLLGRII